MITFVCWKWHSPNYRSSFGPLCVNALRDAIGRHYPRPFRFVCVTNDREGLDREIDVVPDREDFANVPSPHGGNNPSCYRRLRVFAPDAGITFGERLVSIDLDCVITGNLLPLFDRCEDFVVWRDPMNAGGYCGSMFMLTAGARSRVWSEFKPATSPREAMAAGCRGSDQGWLRHVLGPGEATWSRADGVYSYRVDVRKKPLPDDARITFFHGREDPWSPGPQSEAWVREHWGVA